MLDLNGARNIIVNSPNTGANLPGSDATIETIVTDGSINKLGGRTLYLANANTYSGGTNIYEGVLAIGTSTGLGTPGSSTTVYDGATLQLGFTQGGGTDANFTVANESLDIRGQGGVFNAGALRNTVGTNIWNNAVTMDTAARINADAGVLTLNNGVVTLGGAAFNLSVGGLATTQASGIVVMAGAVNLAGGALIKDGSSTLFLNNTGDIISGVTINGSGTNTITSVLATTVRSGTTFGNGPITVNAGGLLRLADPSNINAASGVSVTLNSDTTGLAGFGMGYNGAVPTILASGTALPGQIVANANANGIGGALTLDVPNFTQPLNMGGIGNGRMFLGSSLTSGAGLAASATAIYLAPSLRAGAADVGDVTNTPLYRLGAGGSTAILNFSGGEFENIFVTPNANFVLGLAGTTGGAPLAGGNIGGITLADRNTNLTGSQTITLNQNLILNLQNSYALGGATLAFAEQGAATGVLQLNASLASTTNFAVVGDTFATSGGAANSIFGGVNISGASAPTVTFNMGGTGVIGFQGSITGGSENILKTGGLQTMVFETANNYTGTTTISSGAIMVGADVIPNATGPLGNSSNTIVLNSGGTNLAGVLGLAGQITVAQNITASGGNGKAPQNVIRGQTLGTSVLSGNITISGGTLRLDQIASSTANFQGGVLDVKSIISGTGILMLGNENNTTDNVNTDSNALGTIRLDSSLNTYSGGTTLQAGSRIQIGADTVFTGTAVRANDRQRPVRHHHDRFLRHLWRHGCHRGLWFRPNGGQRPRRVQLECQLDHPVCQSQQPHFLAQLEHSGGCHPAQPHLQRDHGAGRADVLGHYQFQQRQWGQLAQDRCGDHGARGHQYAVQQECGRCQLWQHPVCRRRHGVHRRGCQSRGRHDCRHGDARALCAQSGGHRPHSHAASSATDFRLRGGVLQVTGNVTTARSLIFGTPAGGTRALSAPASMSLRPSSSPFPTRR